MWVYDITFISSEAHPRYTADATIRFISMSRAVEGHVTGELPWQWCDELVDEQSSVLVGKYSFRNL